MKVVKLTFDDVPNAIAQLLSEVNELRKIIEERESNMCLTQDIMTVAQAAEFLGLSKQAVYNKISKKTIPHIKMRGSNGVRLSRKCLTEWLEEGQVIMKIAA
jgi:excisionase family DNA binding protein